ncbi:uncharacterized protein ASCRUDRAFT_81255 [Ascoidea rubescens DSM 1968]|uniref:Uncharacterized protein n=1 Tax=Ascoidea rubescens DSM 1968 TaxID=1344418 RepID=A0A1D2VH10_9ASCO|nr:hypothetical protein ASCRUDRAFT_81255 [Ascoidea rubescens DSM 1968]ODV60926.1 hypothetical protein ASCRUDRAFT_81255 [Ascoidea rubescens DSM 1968]
MCAINPNTLKILEIIKLLKSKIRSLNIFYFLVFITDTITFHYPPICYSLFLAGQSDVPNQIILQQ